MEKPGILCVLLIVLIAVTQCSSFASHQQEHQPATRTVQGNNRWRAGNYFGLTVGTSTHADVLRVLGEPVRKDTPVDQAKDEPHPEVWYVYEGGGEFPGALTVVIDKRSGVLLRVDLSPQNLSRDEAIKHFGKDYIVTRYDFDECLGDEESAPLYESPNGSIISVEYRTRGIAVAVDETGRVNTISYISKPIGARQSRCKSTDRATTNN